MSDHIEPTDSGTPERRTFLAVLTAGIGTIITAVMGITIGRFTIAPAFSGSNEAIWTEVGPIDEIDENKPVRLSVLVSQKAGWGNFNAQRPIWVIRKGDAFTVFSAVCPHLGCTVNTANEKFVCACHNSRWETDGQLTGGPSPRGLDTLEHRVENGVLPGQVSGFQTGSRH